MPQSIDLFLEPLRICSLVRMELSYDLHLTLQTSLPLIGLLFLSAKDLVLGSQVIYLVTRVVLFGHPLLLLAITLILTKMPNRHYHSQALLKRLASVFPLLHKSDKKGKNGRIAVIGGSFEFTGAPYYSAISSLRVGGDLSHIFCSKFSSAAIKSYSP